MLRYIWFLAVILYSVNCVSVPFIKPCKLNDNDCILESAKAAMPSLIAGVPELGIKPLDPLFVPILKSHQAGLDITFTNSTVEGLKTCTIESIKNDPVKQKLSLVIKCATVWSGDYKMEGQMIVLPVKGEGKCVMTTKDIEIKATIDMETVEGADKKPHWHVKKWKHVFDTKTHASFKFTNLFNGNKILADPVLTFMNANWQVVMREMAPPCIYTTVEAVVNAVEAIFKAVPAEDLYIK
ncbi:protein takeout-like [Aphomia sociella]